MNRQQLAVLAVLLLRGPQTPGELKARTERMAPVQSLDEIERVLAELDDRGYARRLGRRPGQKEDRFAQLLGGEDGTGATDREDLGLAATEYTPPPPAGSRPPSRPHRRRRSPTRSSSRGSRRWSRRSPRCARSSRSS